MLIHTKRKARLFSKEIKRFRTAKFRFIVLFGIVIQCCHSGRSVAKSRNLGTKSQLTCLPLRRSFDSHWSLRMTDVIGWLRATIENRVILSVGEAAVEGSTFSKILQ